MGKYDPAQFWSRFQTLSEKDLPILLKTGISQSTLSTWRTQKTYPRADIAVEIAEALQTTVEYLVTGSDNILSRLDPAVVDIALTANKLSPTGQKTLQLIAKDLLTQFPNSPKTLTSQRRRKKRHTPNSIKRRRI
jgi:transcriptional regulator with XRE-family HTH domain